MAWLARTGHHTVTLAQYETWLADGRTKLPAKPVLITADNGIGSFLTGAQPVLARHHFTAVAFLVSGFADGAAGHCAPRVTVASRTFDVQPGCPADNTGWDLTWARLRTLNPGVWEFSLEAGPSGHYVQDYDPKCPAFDACKIPGETATAYEKRVTAETAAGLAALNRELPGRVAPGAWVVPYSDLGYSACARDSRLMFRSGARIISAASCTPQPYDGPRGWLTSYAASRFRAVFVEDAYRNGIDRERFRFDINGQDTLSYFQRTLATFTSAGDFGRLTGRRHP